MHGHTGLLRDEPSRFDAMEAFAPVGLPMQDAALLCRLVRGSAGGRERLIA